MSNIDKRALRKAAMHARTTDDWGCDADNFHDKATPDAVLALLDELEAKDKRIAELETDCWTYENTVKNLLERAGSAESACFEAARILKSGERMALTRAVNILLAAGEDVTHYQYPVVLPEPLGWKSPSGNEVLKKKDVIAALMSAGVPVQGED
ncbi:ead/Ea22-like family protein [Enterobacter roggenkampii]